MGAAVKDLRGKDGHEHHEGHAHQAKQSEETEDGADRTEVNDVGPALAKLLEHGAGSALDQEWGHAHHEERGDDGDIAGAVDGKAVAFADGCDDNAGDGGTDEAGDVDDGGVERDGVREVLLIGFACVARDHLDEEGLAAGHVEGIDKPLKDAEGDDLVDGDDPCESECGECERLDAGKNLGPDEQLTTVDAIDEDAGEGCEKESWDLPGEADGAEQKS